MTQKQYNRYIELSRKYTLDDDFHEFLVLHMARYNVWIASCKFEGNDMSHINVFDKLIYDLSDY